MIIADQLLSEEQEELVIEYTEDFQKDLNSFSLKEQNSVNTKLEQITKAIESNNFAYLFRKLQKVRLTLNEYTSSLYTLTVSLDLKVLLFYEDDPIFNRKIMTLLRVYHSKNMERVLQGLVESFYQDKLCNIQDNEE